MRNLLPLKPWFLEKKRDLPWRTRRDPYATWIAEVMLQQTVAQVVVPYFTRWLHSFPDIESLANASKEEVMKLWEGLGYYSRARNLMKGAQYVMEHFGGELPAARDLLLTIPGIGPYTSAAIAAFAFGERIAAVDANVARFVSRFEELDSPRLLEESATRLLPDNEPWIIAEAMIEMGATICRKKPDCPSCPVQSTCKAFASQRQHELPLPTKRAATTYLEKTILIPHYRDKFLLKNPKPHGVMADLWEFPEAPLICDYEESLPLTIQKHSFTRFVVTLKPALLFLANPFDQTGYSWYSLEEMSKLAFSSGHRRILKDLHDHFTHRNFTWMGRAGDSHL